MPFGCKTKLKTFLTWPRFGREKNRRKYKIVNTYRKVLRTQWHPTQNTIQMNSTIGKVSSLNIYTGSFQKA